jgi:hypothetical protein
MRQRETALRKSDTKVGAVVGNLAKRNMALLRIMGHERHNQLLGARSRYDGSGDD